MRYVVTDTHKPSNLYTNLPYEINITTYYEISYFGLALLSIENRPFPSKLITYV